MNLKLHCIIPLFAVLAFVSRASANECPVPPTSVYPEVSVKIDYDPKTKLYTYDYTLANGANSKLPIGNLTLKISEPPFSTLKPTSKWISSFHEKIGDAPPRLSWLTLSGEIRPGAKTSGFILKSYRAPGPIRYYLQGETEDRVGTPTADDDEPIPECPGFYDHISVLEGSVSGIVEGPAPENQVSVELKLMDEKGERDCGAVSPYEKKGSLHVLLKTPKGLKASEIDLASLRFGVGQAPLLSSRKLGRDEDRILLKFDLRKVDLECDRDRMLFLSGKTKEGKELFGGAPVKMKNCEKRPKRKNPRHS